MSLSGTSIKLSDEIIATLADQLLMGAPVEEVAYRAFAEHGRYDHNTWLRVTQQVYANMEKHIPQVKVLHKARIAKMVWLIVISLILVVVNVIIAMMAGVLYIALGIMCVALFIIGCVKYFPLAQKRDAMLDAAARWTEEHTKTSQQ